MIIKKFDNIQIFKAFELNFIIILKRYEEWMEILRTLERKAKDKNYVNIFQRHKKRELQMPPFFSNFLDS